MKYATKFVTFLGVIMIWGACKKPYNPPAVNNQNNFLVVDGFLNTDGNQSIVKLSRTTNISDTIKLKPELGARVLVEDSQGNKYSSNPYNNGDYAFFLPSNSANKYRLTIVTNDNKEYASNFVDAKASPDIDSISYGIGKNGLSVYANAHDQSNNTRYYRWEYEETYEFTSNYQSFFENTGFDLVYRQIDIYHCWRTDKSSSIILASTAKLNKDIVSEQLLSFIPSNSEKIDKKYSILVKQFGLTKEAYSYWELLRKNTETLGSIFDAQPSQISGNLKCLSDPDVTVIGYVSAGSVKQKRIFISKKLLPREWEKKYPITCEVDTFLFSKNGIGALVGPRPSAMPINSISSKTGPGIIGYTGSAERCVNCTLRGTNIRPSFWE